MKALVYGVRPEPSAARREDGFTDIELKTGHVDDVSDIG
jgi:hypothetical protein